MNMRDLLQALVVTHLPYFVAGALFLLVVRRMRRSLEQLADRLEHTRDRRRARSRAR